MPQTNYLIPLQDGVNWTTAWRGAYNTSVKAFKINIDEINQMLLENNATAIRLYFGLDGTAEKLVLVAVDANDKDIINPTVNGVVISGTYDFCDPCPPTCDLTSPLMTGRMP